MVRYLKSSRLRNDEALDLFQRVLNVAMALLSEETEKSLIDAFKDAVTPYDNALKQSSYTRETQAKNAANEEVENIYRGLWHYIVAMKLHPNATLRKQADDVLFILKTYGKIQNLSYAQRYGALHGLMQELMAIETDVQTSLHLGEWIEGLQVAVAQFRISQDVQVNEKADYQKGIVKETRAVAEKAFSVFVRKVNAKVLLNGEENYAAFVNHVNVIIDEYAQLIKSRETRAKNSKEEEEGSATEEETPSTNTEQDGKDTTSQVA